MFLRYPNQRRVAGDVTVSGLVTLRGHHCHPRVWNGFPASPLSHRTGRNSFPAWFGRVKEGNRSIRGPAVAVIGTVGGEMPAVLAKLPLWKRILEAGN